MFQCRGYGDCRMVFTRSEHLARHVRKHTGERPFRCHCGKNFSRLDNLRQHAQTVHADQPERNEAMMQDLVALHTALAASAAQAQHAQAQVIGKPAGPSRSANASKRSSAAKGARPQSSHGQQTAGRQEAQQHGGMLQAHPTSAPPPSFQPGVPYDASFTYSGHFATGGHGVPMQPASYPQGFTPYPAQFPYDPYMAFPAGHLAPPPPNSVVGAPLVQPYPPSTFPSYHTIAGAASEMTVPLSQAQSNAHASGSLKERQKGRPQPLAIGMYGDPKSTHEAVDDALQSGSMQYQEGAYMSSFPSSQHPYGQPVYGLPHEQQPLGASSDSGVTSSLADQFPTTTAPYAKGSAAPASGGDVGEAPFSTPTGRPVLPPLPSILQEGGGMAAPPSRPLPGSRPSTAIGAGHSTAGATGPPNSIPPSPSGSFYSGAPHSLRPALSASPTTTRFPIRSFPPEPSQPPYAQSLRRTATINAPTSSTRSSPPGSSPFMFHPPPLLPSPSPVAEGQGSSLSAPPPLPRPLSSGRLDPNWLGSLTSRKSAGKVRAVDQEDIARNRPFSSGDVPFRGREMPPPFGVVAEEGEFFADGGESRQPDPQDPEDLQGAPPMFVPAARRVSIASLCSPITDSRPTTASVAFEREDLAERRPKTSPEKSAAPPFGESEGDLTGLSRDSRSVPPEERQEQQNEPQAFRGMVGKGDSSDDASASNGRSSTESPRTNYATVSSGPTTVLSKAATMSPKCHWNASDRAAGAKRAREPEVQIEDGEAPFEEMKRPRFVDGEA